MSHFLGGDYFEFRFARFLTFGPGNMLLQVSIRGGNRNANGFLSMAEKIPSPEARQGAVMRCRDFTSEKCLY